MKTLRTAVVLLVSCVTFFLSLRSAYAAVLTCGETSTGILDTCSCPGAQKMNKVPGTQTLCCGWLKANESDGCAVSDYTLVACGGSYFISGGNYICDCAQTAGFTMNTGKWCCGYKAADGTNTACFQTMQVQVPGGGGGQAALTTAAFETFNTTIFGKKPDAALYTPKGIIGKLLPYLLTFGGLILFVMIIWGGFEMLSGASDPKSQEAGKQRMTAAVIGFILLFASYWLAQIVQAVFGLSIL